MKDRAISVRKSEAKSRRDRPAKAPLSRDVIVSTAIELLSREGLAGLSMRKVAAALDTGPASLYVYISNLEELQAFVLDHALRNVALHDSQDAPWRDRLLTLLNAYLGALLSRPGIGQLSIKATPAGDNFLRLSESIFGLLLEAGLTPINAARGLDMVLLYCSGVAAELDTRRDRTASPFKELTRAIDESIPESFPLIRKYRREIFKEEAPERLNWAFDVLIAGMKATKEDCSDL
ncbi:TetR/AcrR family transcriptional regulator [Rhizobium rhizogenes]|uniref:TetR/AcrR family transcriptional regulator n=1 Tax=Rhizobium rhizogenes TaxID=359 RepID=UPI001573F4ED|nr:TetR/AcrR family transcriptional regulator C-terminal domain-containing protein [Rhizobium rhizogenes]NTF85460.1 TetR/AcrR family transcriptional regulator [Rhizobium rhizogenes]